MKVNIHAGHNPGGRMNCEAIGLTKESTEARKVKEDSFYLKWEHLKKKLQLKH